MVMNGAGTPLFCAAYAYDAVSRLRTLSDGTRCAVYSYLTNSAQVASLDFWNNGQTVMTTRRQYDSANRLRATETTAQGSPVASFTYAYNLAGQRTNVTLGPDSSQWRHQYDFLGQLTNGQKVWRDGTPVAGQQFRYFFDDIGNRTSTQAGGDTNGRSLRAARYTNNLLNELTSREVPGAADVTGRAHASATVTVNGQAVSRAGEYYRRELALNNTLGPIYQPVTNQATLAGATDTSTGTILLPGTPQQFWHDLDGNLLSDGVWTNRWDAENRLVEMQTTTAAVAAGVPAQKLAFTYDPLGRRTSKTVFNWITGDWSLITHHRFLYDGWNLVAVLASDLSPLISFTWGLDLSGTEQGAGGVGGLLAVTVHTGTNAGTYFPAYDGNGNVVALVNATNGAPAARYEYGPFHELIRATGPLARQNPFLAASKYYDWETGLYYYGFRYYHPCTGRWLSRDPLDEASALNLLNFLANAPTATQDLLGLTDYLLYTGIRRPSSYSGGESPVRPLVPAAVWSLKDNLIWTVDGTDEARWFLRDARARVATEKAQEAFRRKINAKLCGMGKGSVIRPFIVKPASDERGGADYEFSQPVTERAFVLGWYEYRLTSLVSEKRNLHVRWDAELTIVDKLGWEREEYGVIFPYLLGKVLPEKSAERLGGWANDFMDRLFGQSREFSRGVLRLSGEADCCNWPTSR